MGKVGGEREKFEEIKGFILHGKLAAFMCQLQTHLIPGCFCTGEWFKGIYLLLEILELTFLLFLLYHFQNTYTRFLLLTFLLCVFKDNS